MIYFRAPIVTNTGFYRYIDNIVAALASRGHEVQVFPSSVERQYGDQESDRLHTRFVLQPPRNCRWELLLNGLCNAEPTKKHCARISMWESTQMASDIIDYYNRAYSCLLTPSRWCKQVFRRNGFRKPIYVAPLGVDPLLYHWMPQRFNGKFVFGVTGKMMTLHHRKDMFRIAELFVRAFPRETDVELWIKGFPDDAALPDKHPFDSRIRITKIAVSEVDYIQKFFANINVLINSSRGEGWGLCQSEALACGRPVIMPNYGGLAEFFDPTACYGVGYEEQNVEGVTDYKPYKGCMCEMHDDDVIDAMRFAYNNPADVVQRGLISARKMLQFTWERAAILHEKALAEIGAL